MAGDKDLQLLLSNIMSMTVVCRSCDSNDSCFQPIANCRIGYVAR